MKRKIGKRIVRPATPEEKARFEQIRKSIERELQDFKGRARKAADPFGEGEDGLQNPAGQNPRTDISDL